MKKIVTVFPIILVFVMISCAGDKKKEAPKKEEATVPVGVTFNEKILMRLESRGDHWDITRAEDGFQVVSMDDGNWLDQDIYKSKLHNHLYRITREADNFERKDIPNYSELSDEGGSWFVTYGTRKV